MLIKNSTLLALGQDDTGRSQHPEFMVPFVEEIAVFCGDESSHYDVFVETFFFVFLLIFEKCYSNHLI